MKKKGTKMQRAKFVRDRLSSAIAMSDNTMKIAVCVEDQEQFDEYTAAMRGRKGNKMVSIEIGAIPAGCMT